jgi:hypothetical protein
MHTLARTSLFAALAALTFGPLEAPPSPAAPGAPAPPGRVVYLARDLPEQRLLALTAAVAASPDALLLLDSDKLSPYLREFLAAYKPDRLVPVGAFPDGLADLERRLKFKPAAPVRWESGPPREIWKALFPKAEAVVVCPAEPRGLLLQSACLAGSLRAPLYVLEGRSGETARLRELVVGWGARRAHLAGAARSLAGSLPGVECLKLADADAVAAARLRVLSRAGDADCLVVANPDDDGAGLGGMAALAPWIALQKRAPLLLTDPKGDNVEEVVQRALRRPSLREADALLLVGNLQALPMRQRPNPIPADKDPHIDMEPLTPTGKEPFSFATGRLFHDEPGVAPLILARQRLLADARGKRRALVVSNPGNSLPLLETFSRNTAQELRNAGYETAALFGKEVSAERLRKQMTENDVILWEGHHNTLIKDYDMPSWTEPMPPALVFLQSCLALKDYKVQPLLSRGAVAVVGSSTRTYSASGGACSLAFFDALLYEGQTLGGSLRQSKNFLLAYALLKEKRLGKEATRTGANLRAAWSFTLWGDPTLRLPPPDGAPARPPVRHEVAGDVIVLALPDSHPDKVTTSRYQSEIPANGRLAGLLRKEKTDDGQPLVPFVFAEVYLPRGKRGQTPTLSSKLPSSHWVFCWDERRRCGYLLAAPRARDEKELRFRVHWPSEVAAGPAAADEVGAGR